MNLISDVQRSLTCLIEIRRGKDMSTENSFYPQVRNQQITVQAELSENKDEGRGGARRVKRSVIKAMTVLGESNEEN